MKKGLLNERMMWGRLKDMLCPKCNADLKAGVLSDELLCTICDFRISRMKFDNVVGNLYNPKPRTRQEEERDFDNNWNRFSQG